MDSLERIGRLRRRRVIGINSGTSADGIDVVLLEIGGHGWASRLRALRFRTLPYPRPLGRSLHRLLERLSDGSTSPVDAREVFDLDLRLGRAMGEAARRFRQWARRSGLACHLVGSHGQTVWHRPDSGSAGTLTVQLGHPPTIAEVAGLPVVADFRQADAVAGGQGAPLTPALDYLLFRKASSDTVTLNLGGIANLSLVRRRRPPSEVIGFDVGPCNLLLDGIYRRQRLGGYDRGGRLALRGRPLLGVVEEALRDPFFRAPPPRTAGRERFGTGFVEGFMRAVGRRSAADHLATAVVFIARSIRRALQDHLPAGFDPSRVVASGGGWHNRALRECLADELRELGMELEAFREAGLSADSKEAGLFAWLASEAVCGGRAHLPQATGAAGPRILGILVPRG